MNIEGLPVKAVPESFRRNPRDKVRLQNRTKRCAKQSATSTRSNTVANQADMTRPTERTTSILKRV